MQMSYVYFMWFKISPIHYERKLHSCNDMKSQESSIFNTNKLKAWQQKYGMHWIEYT